MTDRSLISLDRAMLRDGAPSTRLILVRHGQQEEMPAVLAPRAWLDPQLSELGRRQAALVARCLETEDVAALACSHMRRACQTAEEIRDRCDAPLMVEPSLAEVDAYTNLADGEWPVDRMGEIAWVGAQARFATERRWQVFPFSESGAALRRRVSTTVEGLIESHSGGTIVIVCHGGVINAYLADILGTAADMFFMPGHASLTRVIAGANGARVIDSLNDRRHLEAAGLVTY